MKILLVSHGSFSKGLSETMTMVLGPQEDLDYLGLYPEKSVDDLKTCVEEKLKEYGDEEVLVFTDLYFGSPFNAVVQLMERYDVYHITGINVPLLMETIVMKNNGKSIEEICDEVIRLASGSVCDVRKQFKELLEGEDSK